MARKVEATLTLFELSTNRLKYKVKCQNAIDFIDLWCYNALRPLSGCPVWRHMAAKTCTLQVVGISAIYCLTVHWLHGLSANYINHLFMACLYQNNQHIYSQFSKTIYTSPDLIHNEKTHPYFLAHAWKQGSVLHIMSGSGDHHVVVWPPTHEMSLFAAVFTC